MQKYSFFTWYGHGISSASCFAIQIILTDWYDRLQHMDKSAAKHWNFLCLHDWEEKQKLMRKCPYLQSEKNHKHCYPPSPSSATKPGETACTGCFCSLTGGICWWLHPAVPLLWEPHQKHWKEGRQKWHCSSRGSRNRGQKTVLQLNLPECFSGWGNLQGLAQKTQC